jgi:hypothetical protein
MEEALWKKQYDSLRTMDFPLYACQCRDPLGVTEKGAGREYTTYTQVTEGRFRFQTVILNEDMRYRPIDPHASTIETELAATELRAVLKGCALAPRTWHAACDGKRVHHARTAALNKLLERGDRSVHCAAVTDTAQDVVRDNMGIPRLQMAVYSDTYITKGTDVMVYSRGAFVLTGAELSTHDEPLGNEYSVQHKLPNGTVLLIMGNPAASTGCFVNESATSSNLCFEPLIFVDEALQPHMHVVMRTTDAVKKGTEMTLNYGGDVCENSDNFRAHHRRNVLRQIAICQLGMHLIL